MKGWARRKSGAKYMDVSLRTYDSYLRSGLRHIKLNGIVLSKYEWIDSFLEKRENPGPDIDRIVDEVCREIQK